MRRFMRMAEEGTGRKAGVNFVDHLVLLRIWIAVLRSRMEHRRDTEAMKSNAYEEKGRQDRSAQRLALYKRTMILHACRCLCLAGHVGIFVLGCTLAHGRVSADTAPLATIYGMLLFCLMKTYRGFCVGECERKSVFAGQLISVMVSLFCVLVIVGMMLHGPPRLPGAALIALMSSVWSMLWTACADRAYCALYRARRTVIVYENSRALAAMAANCRAQTQFEIDKVINIGDYAGRMDALKEALKEALGGAEAVFLCGLCTRQRDELLKYCMMRDVCVYIRPNIGDLLMGMAVPGQMFGAPMLCCSRQGAACFYPVVKRVMDIALSVLALAAASPLMFLIALAIHREDRGPVIYRQKRLTQDGRVFEILKFRSMRVDAEADGIPRLCAEGDERVTRVGAWIRAYRLDELPQLINIIRGEMSLVGPRPERPEIAAAYMENLPEFGMRLWVKAGLTGYAQVHGRYDTQPYDKLQMDLAYIAGMSFLQDVKLMLQTVWVLFDRDDARVNIERKSAAEAGAQAKEMAGGVKKPA